MVGARDRPDQAEVLDPVTGKPIIDERLTSLVIGPEEEAQELDDEITGPEDQVVENPSRSQDGTLMIAHIEDPDDVDDVVSALRKQWRNARRDRGLDS